MQFYRSIGVPKDSSKNISAKGLEEDIREGMNAVAINMSDIQPDPSKPLIGTVGETVEEGQELLSKVGFKGNMKTLREDV